VNSTVASIVADTDVPLCTPSVVVGVAGTTGKDAGSSPCRKVVRQVERHSKVFKYVKEFKDFYNII
jgi:hypothetical protein